MWVETDRGALGLHLGMAAGSPWTSPRPTAPGTDSRSQFEDGGRLALHDRRRLGRVVLDPDLDRLGPDAAEVGREEFRERVGRGSAPLKARIMDQGHRRRGEPAGRRDAVAAGLSPLLPRASWTTTSSTTCAGCCAEPRARPSARAACTPAT